jgi:hypothetical protein
MVHRSRFKNAANARQATDANSEWRGETGSNATGFGAGLWLPRLTGDGADDRTSNDARGRGATGRAGCSIARGERTVRGGWSWCWCWWRLSIRSIVDNLKRYVRGFVKTRNIASSETFHKHNLLTHPKRGEVRDQKLARASRRCSNCSGQQHSLHTSCSTRGILLRPIVLVLKRVNRHARDGRIASKFIRERREATD